MSSCMRFRRFVVWNIHTIIFPPISISLLLSVPCRCNLSLLFFMKSLSRRIDASILSSMLASPLPPSFLDTCNLCHLSDVGAYASSLVFLFICSSSFLVHFKNGHKSFTRWGRPDVYLFDKFPASEFGFVNISRSPEILFFDFFFQLDCLLVSTSNKNKCL